MDDIANYENLIKVLVKEKPAETEEEKEVEKKERKPRKKTEEQMFVVPKKD
tara:strand:+ start:2997 stop:3149 length:153 start_codon:yes stop_codon:yes gene_type:complete